MLYRKQDFGLFVEPTLRTREGQRIFECARLAGRGWTPSQAWRARTRSAPRFLLRTNRSGRLQDGRPARNLALDQVRKRLRRTARRKSGSFPPPALPGLNSHTSVEITRPGAIGNITRR
jgi:hypothetical protein